MLYLNQAGTSWPKPPPVQEAVRASLAAPIETWANSFESHHQDVCRAFGIANSDRLLLTPGATSALSVAILDHAWRSGDRVLVSGLEHHALYRPVQQLIERGIEVKVVPPGDGYAVSMETLRAELRRGGVRLVAMTAASNVTGDMLPFSDIIALAHEHGALALVDAAQVAGWIPIDVIALDVDLLAFTGHKGAQGPWGIGGLYVSQRVQMASPNASCELPVAGKAPCAPMPGYCDVGSVDRAALAGLVAGLHWLDVPERSDRLARARKQAAVVYESLLACPDVVLHGFTPPESRMPTVSLTVKGRSPAELASALLERGVFVSGGLQCAPLAHETLGTEPEGVLRISFGPGNRAGDEEIVSAALQEVIGRR